MTKDEIMMLDIEQIEARNAEIIDELREADAEGIERLSAELDAIKERREVINAEIEQRKKAVAEVLKSATVIEKNEEENKMEVRNTPEYVNAYADYIKSGKDTECRALLTENVSGTVPVPELVYDIVKTAWNREGIMALVRKSYLRGNLKVGFEISGTDAVVHTEGAAAVSEENLILGTVNLVPASIKKWISISDEVLDLRGEAFLNYIYDELAYRIAKKAADTLIAKIEACGTVSTTTCPAVPKVTAASIGVGTVASAMAMLSDDAANPAVIMNKQTWGAFKAAQYANGFSVDPFEGLPVVFNNTIKAFSAASTGNTYAIVGDLGQGAIANFPNGDGIEFKFDDTSLMTQDLVRVLGREYVALGVIAPDAFVKIVK